MLYRAEARQHGAADIAWEGTAVADAAAAKEAGSWHVGARCARV